MYTLEYRRDLKNIQNRILGATSGKAWHDLNDRFQVFIEKERRSWMSAMFYLLENGVAIAEGKVADRKSEASWLVLKAAINNYTINSRREKWGETILALLEIALTAEEAKYGDKK